MDSERYMTETLSHRNNEIISTNNEITQEQYFPARP